jgi:integrase
MARGTMGLGRLYKRGADGFWWFAIGLGGKKHRMSTKLRGGTPNNPPPEVLLWRARKLTELGQAGAAGLKAEVVRVSDILDMLWTRYEAEGRAQSLRTSKARVAALRAGLGTWKALELKADRILEYAVQRKRAGAAIATVNMEMSLLARAYRVAIDCGRLMYAPKVPRLPGVNVRRGSVSDAHIAQIRELLPPNFADVIWFLRLTGWRLQEALGLEWSRVDLPEQVVRLDTSKTGEPRELAFGTYPDLKELLARRYDARGLSPYVFVGPRGGRVNACTLRGLWDAACEKAGIPEAILHDLRRSMVRAMNRAGVERSVAMTITGHTSEAVYRQYGIVDTVGQKRELAKLANVPEDRVLVPAERFRLAGLVRALRQLVAEALPHIANTEAAADVLARMRAAIGEGQGRDQTASAR